MSFDPLKGKIDELRSFILKLETHFQGLNEEQRKKHNTIIGISDIISIVSLLQEYKNMLIPYKSPVTTHQIIIGKPEPDYVTKEQLTIQLETINTHITYLTKFIEQLEKEVKFNSSGGYC